MRQYSHIQDEAKIITGYYFVFTYKYKVLSVYSDFTADFSIEKKKSDYIDECICDTVVIIKIYI